MPDLPRSRRTVRSLPPGEADLSLVSHALEVAAQAPSGANRQPWRFLVVTDPGLKPRIRGAEEGERRFYEGVSGELRERLLSRGFGPEKPSLEEAPVPTTVFSRRGEPHSSESVWLAVGWILRALEELGTVAYTPSDPGLVEGAVGAPPDLRLGVVLPVGVPAGEASKLPRGPLSELSLIHI